MPRFAVAAVRLLPLATLLTSLTVVATGTTAAAAPVDPPTCVVSPYANEDLDVDLATPFRTGHEVWVANDRVYVLGYRGMNTPVTQVFSTTGQLVEEFEFLTASIDEAGNLWGYANDGVRAQVRNASGEVVANLPSDARIGSNPWRPWTFAMGDYTWVETSAGYDIYDASFTRVSQIEAVMYDGGGHDTRQYAIADDTVALPAPIAEGAWLALYAPDGGVVAKPDRPAGFEGASLQGIYIAGDYVYAYAPAANGEALAAYSLEGAYLGLVNTPGYLSVAALGGLHLPNAGPAAVAGDSLYWIEVATSTSSGSGQLIRVNGMSAEAFPLREPQYLFSVGDVVYVNEYRSRATTTMRSFDPLGNELQEIEGFGDSYLVLNAEAAAVTETLTLNPSDDLEATMTLVTSSGSAAGYLDVPDPELYWLYQSAFDGKLFAHVGPDDSSSSASLTLYDATGCLPDGLFADDDGSVFEDDIEWLANAGITRGCNPPVNDRFCPTEPVTRGQMAAFLVRALDLIDDGGGSPFVDDDDSIFETDIAKLAAAGITRGCNPPTNDRYCPDDRVTRGQMAAFLVRALGYTNDGGGDLFGDDDDSIFENAIDRLATAGVTRGCNPPVNDRYCPSADVTRGQMAAFLHRALG